MIHIHVRGHQEVHSCECEENATVAKLLRQLVHMGVLTDSEIKDLHLFADDDDDELPHSQQIETKQHGKRFHINRCRKIEVTFVHVDETATSAFGPAATIRRLIRWARQEFKVDKDTRFDLRLGGPDADPLPLDAHVGSYVDGYNCELKLFFTPSCRIQGKV